MVVLLECIRGFDAAFTPKQGEMWDGFNVHACFSCELMTLISSHYLEASLVGMTSSRQPNPKGLSQDLRTGLADSSAV